MDEHDIRREVARREREEREALAVARARSDRSGKEVFDLDALEEMYDTSSFTGYLPDRAGREHRWAVKYYLQYPDIRTLAEFAEYLNAVDVYR